MQGSFRRCCVTVVGVGFLWLWFTLKVPREVEDDQNRMAIEAQEDQALPLPRPQEGSYRRRKDLEPLEDWQNLTFKYWEKIQQRKKTLGVLLLLEDDTLCAPNFISHVQWKVDTLGSQPWALLELSNLGFLGKLFRSGDLPVLAHFLLLFYREKPLARLLPHFLTLLAQKDPILCRPFLFYHRVSYHAPNDSQKASGTQKKSPYAPDNPPGAVFTDMKVFEVHFPWEAYTLDESFFWTH
ncbi:hypothetical protein E2I00_010367, partial [Balaenoptera physalus]